MRLRSILVLERINLLFMGMAGGMWLANFQGVDSSSIRATLLGLLAVHVVGITTVRRRAMHRELDGKTLDVDLSYPEDSTE